MITVDSDVLVRLLVGDDAAQAARARALFDQAAASDQLIWVSDTVLVEMVWTLSRVYGRTRADIVAALLALASHGTVVLESPEAVEAAIELYERGPADFADGLLCAKAALAGCKQVATFDRGMKGLKLVKVL